MFSPQKNHHFPSKISYGQVPPTRHLSPITQQLPTRKASSVMEKAHDSLHCHMLPPWHVKPSHMNFLARQHQGHYPPSFPRISVIDYLPESTAQFCRVAFWMNQFTMTIKWPLQPNSCPCHCSHQRTPRAPHHSIANQIYNAFTSKPHEICLNWRAWINFCSALNWKLYTFQIAPLIKQSIKTPVCNRGLCESHWLLCFCL